MFNGKKECQEVGTDVKVNVDVTSIVKYVCIAGAFIVAVIFLSRYIGKCIKAK